MSVSRIRLHGLDPLRCVVFAVAMVSEANAAEADPVRELLIRAAIAKEEAIASGVSERWEQALQLFRECHAANPTAATAFEIGYAAQRLAMEGLTAEAYSLAIQLGLTGTAALKARSYLSERADANAKLEFRCPTGTSAIVEGLKMGVETLQGPLLMLPGEVHLECTATDREPLTTTIRLRQRQHHIVSLISDRSETLPTSAGFDAPGTEPFAKGEQPTSVAVRKDKRSSPKEIRTTQGRAKRAISAPLSQVGRVLLGSGASVATVGAALAIFSVGRIRHSRAALANACLVQLGGPDTCSNARPGMQATAQSHSDSIATWQAVQTGSWIGVGVGSLAALTGLVNLLTSRTVPAGEAGMELTSTQLAFHYRGKF
ncbi:MAG TPA: hypothetical protein VIV60_13145 [Polyangiaceae bacterium]